MKKRFVQVVFSLAIVFSLLTQLSPVEAFSDTSSEDLSPYASEYLDSIDVKRSQATEVLEYQQIISVLNEYYADDYALYVRIYKLYHSDISGIISSEREKKISAMYSLMSLYEKCDAETKRMIKTFFFQYAKDSEEKALYSFYEQICSAKTSTGIQTKGYNFKENFNPSIAASWAFNNYDKFDPKFPNLSELNGDCTNFVSQALYYGGMKMHNNWYCQKRNNYYPTPKTVSELDYSWALSDPSPFISVKTFTEYWTGQADAYYEFSKDDYVKNHETYYNKPIYTGDVVILCKKTLWWTTPTHAMIITRYDSTNKDFLLAGHSQPRQQHPLLTAISNYSQVRFLCL
jgi:hypothetical protein